MHVRLFPFLIALLLLSCLTARAQEQPSIEFTLIPFAEAGGTERMDTIRGKTNGATRDQLIVLYAKSGRWYVQPYVDQPYTKLEPDLTWQASTHLGTEYAALLVQPGYKPASVMDALPGPGGGVLAVTVVHGTPFFWQTWWFRLLMVITAVFLLLLLYRWRQRRLIRELNLRFEQRLAERTRIAQDLHDTLLQGLLSASMQLHVADEQIPQDSPAKQLVGRVLELMRQVIDEGRNAVHGLRTPGSDFLDLESSFSGIQQELPTTQSIDYQMTVEGTSRPLRPVIRDEVYRVGHEALVNAFRHSNGHKVELEIEYTVKQLRLLVRDDGKGIDPEVVREGREGHWGLSGMRERAHEIGGKLRVWSREGAGTEVELTIPAHIAYESNGAGGSWLARLFQLKSVGGNEK